MSEVAAMHRFFVVSVLRWRVLAAIVLIASGFAGDTASAHEAGAVSLEPGSSFKECSHCPTMVVVPPGTFAMGFDGGEEGRYEGPVRQVSIGKSFAVGLYEVTQAEYRAFVEATGRSGPAGCNVLRPVTNKLERDE